MTTDNTPGVPAVEPDPKSERNLVELLTRKVVGQTTAMQSIVPYIQMYQAGLNPEGRPVGIFLLLGPTGTGKTRTVEALAEVLHGSDRKVVKVDCGEFQSDHEVAKLIGAPPGYLGHRETQPVLTQEKLSASTSADCPLSIVLFDEIEKAAPALSTLLLGILDRATLTLGDNTVVNFEQSLIFLTSNLGAREMMKEMRPDLGFQGVRRSQPGRSRGEAREHRRRRGSAALLARVRQPHRRRHHLSAARRAGAGGDSRASHRRSAASRQHAAGQPIVRDRGVDRRREAFPARARHQRRIRRARAEAHHPPPPDAAARGAGRQGRRRAGRAGRGRLDRRARRA